MNKVALITGASSGIGMELARFHAAQGGDLIVVARREDKLQKLQEELEGEFGTKVIVILKDLSQPNAAEELFSQIKAQNVTVEYLINNAGFGGHGFFYERDLKKEEAMINLNITTLTALTRLFLPEMIERNSGRILNVGSVAGFVPGPLQAVYYATKAFVNSFSEALANELQSTNVTVTALCPGTTESEFAQEADLTNVRSFKRKLPSSAAVAAYGYEAMLQGKIIAVHGLDNKFLVHFLLRISPRAMITQISRGMMEKV